MTTMQILEWTKEDDELYGIHWYRKEPDIVITCGHCCKEFDKAPTLSIKGNRCPHCGTRNRDVQC